MQSLFIKILTLLLFITLVTGFVVYHIGFYEQEEESVHIFIKGLKVDTTTANSVQLEQEPISHTLEESWIMSGTKSMVIPRHKKSLTRIILESPFLGNQFVVDTSLLQNDSLNQFDSILQETL